jgi:hypothetical protein
MKSRPRSSPKKPKRRNQPRPPSYTAPQREWIRAALFAYYKAEQAAQGTSNFTWKDVAEAIFLYTDVKIDGDSLNQFATGQVSRGRVRGSLPEHLHAIVRFLTDPEINALSLEELKEPEIPYHFALHLMESLKYRDRKRPTQPPPWLKGTFRAIVRSDGRISDIRLTVMISIDGNVVHLIEEEDVYRHAGEKDPASWSSYERKLNHFSFNESRGWGVLTPEDNLLGFMKRKVIDEYRDNYFYATMGVIPDFSDKADIEHLALLAYDAPYGLEDEWEDKQRWFQEKSQKTVSKLRHFVRITGDDDVRGSGN